MKRRFLSVLLVLTLILASASTVFASTAEWPTYGGNNQHTGLTTSSVPTTAAAADFYSAVVQNPGSWSIITNTPVMQTENGVTYAYILYKGTSTARIAKIACSAGTGISIGDVIWDINAGGSAANQLSTPLLYDDSLYYATTLSSSAGSISGFSKKKITQTLTQTVSLSAGGSYRLYVPCKLDTSSSGATLSISVTKPDNTTVGLDVDNNSVNETGTNLTRVLTTNTSTSYLNKNYSDVFASAGTYTISYTFTRSAGSYSSGDIYLYKNENELHKINDVTVSSNPQISDVATNLPGMGQINTPITTDGTYIYYGTWYSATTNGQYYQVKISDGTYKYFTTGTGYGFYWAGAITKGNYVYVGGDGGYLYYRSVSNFDTTGGSISLGSSAGNVRSSISTDGTYLYFTSQGGYLWRATPNGSSTTVTSVSLGGTSTSTPAITSSSIYVGYYGSFSSGGIQRASISNFSSGVTTLSFTADVDEDGVVETFSQPVQSSIVVKSVSSTDYIYFTTNSTNGAGYCCSYSGGTTTNIWKTAKGGYALQGMAAGGGSLIFGNDNGRYYIIY